MKFLKFAIVAMVAAAVSGCGSKVKVPEGTAAVAYLQADKAVETLVDSAKDVVGDLPDSLKKMGGDVDAQLKEFLKQKEENFDKYVKINWVLFGTVADEKKLSSEPQPFVVVNVKIKDMKTFDENVKGMGETKIGEARTWKIPFPTDSLSFVPVPREVYRMFRNASLHIGLLKDSYVLVATSEDQLKALVELYSGNGKESPDFKDIAELEGDAFLKIAVKPVGVLLQNNSYLKERLTKVAAVSGDQELLEALYGVKRVVIQAGVKYGLSGAKLTVEAGTSDAAEFFESLFNVGKFFLRGYTDWALYEAVNGGVPVKDLAKYGNMIREGIEVDRSGTDVSFKTFVNVKDMLRFGLKDFENLMK